MITKSVNTNLVICLLFIYACGLLSIGITKDWRLIHEDNGAMHTTLALSHLQLGLAETRAHDVFFNPTTGEANIYGHHPPLTALILAGVFAVTGSDAPYVARIVPIVFHLGSLSLFVLILSRFFSKGIAIFGGFFMATVPMSAFFGRMVNYEPLCLFAIILQLFGYAKFKDDMSKQGLGWLCLGIFLGGLVDWGAFFFAAAFVVVEIIRAIRKQTYSGLLLLTTIGASVTIFLFDIWHFWYAGHGALSAFQTVLFREHQDFNFVRFCFGQIDIFRRYYTHAGLISCVIIVVCLVLPKSSLAKSIIYAPGAPIIKDLLISSGIAAMAYVWAAPSWARIHMYWQFYFLPFVILSMSLVWSSLWHNFFKTRSWVFRAFAVLFIVEIFITSAYMLHLRHTRIGSYAVRQTAEFRTIYITPAHVDEDNY